MTYPLLSRSLKFGCLGICFEAIFELIMLSAEAVVCFASISTSCDIFLTIYSPSSSVLLLKERYLSRIGARENLSYSF